MNRFRKTGNHFTDKTIDPITEEFKQIALEAGIEMEVQDEYGQENGDYGQEYEGGEKEVFIDVDMKTASLDRAKDEAEFNKVSRFYNILFSGRLLQMVNLISSVATNNAYASHILFNIAHPERIGTLIGILCNGTP